MLANVNANGAMQQTVAQRPEGSSEFSWNEKCINLKTIIWSHDILCLQVPHALSEHVKANSKNDLSAWSFLKTPSHSLQFFSAHLIRNSVNSNFFLGFVCSDKPMQTAQKLVQVPPA